MLTVRRVCCIGGGFAGGSHGTVIAAKCSKLTVTVVDEDKEKIDLWNSESPPVSEQELKNMVNDCRNKNLFFSTDVITSIREAELIFICVRLPLKDNEQNEIDLQEVEKAVRLISDFSYTEKIIVERSSIASRAAELLSKMLSSHKRLRLLSNPEFFSNETAVQDLLFPERVLIIGESDTPEGVCAINQLRTLYEHWVPPEKIVVGNTRESQLSKLAVDAILARRMSNISSLCALCKASDADISQISRALAMDSRIGDKYLNVGLGFGNGSFMKNLQIMVGLCKALDFPEIANYWQQALNVNKLQESGFSRKIMHCLFNFSQSRHIAIFGFSHKNDIFDDRESAAIMICKDLLSGGAILNIYEPKTNAGKMKEVLQFLNKETEQNSVKVFNDPYEATAETQAIVVCAARDEFKNFNYETIFHDMIKPAYIFDGQNVLPYNQLEKIGFFIESTGFD